MKYSAPWLLPERAADFMVELYHALARSAVLLSTATRVSSARRRTRPGHTLCSTSPRAQCGIDRAVRAQRT